MRWNPTEEILTEIRDTLFKECESRALDNANDLDAVMEVITRVIQKHYNKNLTAVYKAMTHHGGQR